jgi:sugar lactone lactonase YvrE
MLLLSVGCAPPSGTEDSTGTTGGETDAPGTTGEPTTGPQAACEPFEPFELDVQAEPNGLYWRGDLSTLFIADDDNNRILTRTEDGMGGVFAEIPNPSNDPGSDGLGQLAAAADGTLFVPRFGFDDPTLGGVFRLAPDGTPTQISGLAANVRRVGLAYDDDSGVLYVATYNKDSEGVFVGWIAAVDPVNGGETTIVSGLEKPVGILSLGGKLYVGDQPTRKIYSVDLADPALVLLTDEVVALDQFTASGDDDNFFALAYDETLMTGYVYRVNVNGTFAIAAQGSWEPRGIAFDGVSRIFVSERDAQRIAVVPAC